VTYTGHDGATCRLMYLPSIPSWLKRASVNARQCAGDRYKKTAPAKRKPSSFSLKSPLTKNKLLRVSYTLDLQSLPVYKISKRLETGGDFYSIFAAISAARTH
jgi:hypothetical protein